MSKTKKNQSRPRFICRKCGTMWVNCEPVCLLCKIYGTPLNEGAKKLLKKRSGAT